MRSMSSPRSRPLSAALYTGLLAAGLLPGCVGRAKLDEIGKAKIINEKRHDARDYLAKFKATDSKDLDSLERYVRLQQETTEIAPATCPNCWASFGEALSMLGWYHWLKYSELEDESEGAKGRQSAEIQAQADKEKSEWVKNFTLSNQAFETFFRDPSVPYKHPYFFERVMRHYELLGNYERAIYYLQKYEESYPFFLRKMEEPERKRVDKLRRLYKQEAQRQKERGVRGESEEEGSGAESRPAPARRKAARANSTRMLDQSVE
jgi:hypothetical protein